MCQVSQVQMKILLPFINGWSLKYNFNNHFDNVDNYSYLFSGIRAFPNVVAYNMRLRQFESAIDLLVDCLLKTLF